MGRGGAIYLSYTALVLLSDITPCTAGLWDVDIDLDPAPLPQDGPPFSAHATRDRSLLPGQVVGIVGAYVAFVVLLGSFLLTIGRKARKRAQDMVDRPTEMVKPMSRLMSPDVNDGDSFFGKLRKKTSRSGSMRSGRSIVHSPGSVTSFDPQVIEQNRQRDQEDLARLYGAVYGDEDRKSASVTETPQAQPPQYARSQQPPLTINRPDLQRVQTTESLPQSPLSPTTPRSPSVRAIYPQDVASPRRADYPTTPRSPPVTGGLPKSPRDGRSVSFGSNKAPDLPTQTAPQKIKKSIKNLRITRPSGFNADNDDDARTPLSPRTFGEPGTAPLPTGRTNDSSQYPPTTPGTGRSFPYPGEEMDEVADLPQAHPQRTSYYQYDNQAQAITDAASTRTDPTGTTQQNRSGNTAVGGLNKILPFRAYQAQNSNPRSPTGRWNVPLRSPGLLSPGPKTSDIEERVLEVPGRHLAIPMTGQLTGAKTPYSPYFPGELVTPVFSPLTTRHERKQLEKERKRERGAATTEDLVADEKDLWSSGY